MNPRKNGYRRWRVGRCRWGLEQTQSFNELSSIRTRASAVTSGWSTGITCRKVTARILASSFATVLLWLSRTQRFLTARLSSGRRLFIDLTGETEVIFIATIFLQYKHPAVCEIRRKP